MTPDGPSDATGKSSDRGGANGPLLLDRHRALERLAEACRLYVLSLLVHERIPIGAVDSAPLAAKSLRLALSLLLQLHGLEAPDEFEGLARAAAELARTQGLGFSEATEELLLVREMAVAFEHATPPVPRPLGRRYHRAIIHIRDVLDDISEDLDSRLPAAREGFLRRARGAALVAALLAAGLALGVARRRGHAPAPGASAAGTERAAHSAPIDLPPAFRASYFRGIDLADPAFERRDERIDFHWGAAAPFGLTDNDHFSIRWKGRLFVSDRAFCDFWLTSDDGSRLFVDDTLVIDNWGGHSATTKDARVELAAGVHSVTVEYFEDVGEAVIRLEWASDRAQRRVLGGADLR